jgi:hypothetical protein
VCVQGSIRSPPLKQKPHASDSELTKWHTVDDENDLELGSLESCTPRVVRGAHSTRIRCDLSVSDAPTHYFVQRLFADLPMQHVWRAIATLRGALTGAPQRTHLTPALLAMHTSCMQSSVQPLHPPVPLSQPQPAAPHRHFSMTVPHMLLDQRTRAHLQDMHARRRSDDVISIAPSVLSDTSIRSACTLEATQSLQSAATQATEPGGGKGHRMGRAARKQFALSVCKLWEQYFDTHGRPVHGHSCTVHSKALNATSQQQEATPLWFDRSAVIAALEGLHEIKGIPGIESLLEQVSESFEGLSRSASQSSWSQLKAGSVSAAPKLARLGEQLAVCAAVVNAACAHSQQLHSALRSTTEQGTPVSFDTGSGAAAVLLGSPDWRSIAETMGVIWKHLLVEEDNSALSQEPYGRIDPKRHKAESSTAGMQPNTDQHAENQSTKDFSAEVTLNNELRRWSRSWGDFERVCSARGVRLKLNVEHAEAWPSLLLVTFGIWCMAALLQLASVEPRPELWGRYVAALNHLQGVLFVSVSLCAQVRGSSGWTPQGWIDHRDIVDLSRFGMGSTVSAGSSLRSVLGHVQHSVNATGEGLQAMHNELLHLIQMVDSHVNSCGCSHQRTTSAAAAFAKGKVNIISAIKRLRSHILSGERYNPGKSEKMLHAKFQQHVRTGQSGTWTSGRGGCQRLDRRVQGQEHPSVRGFGSPNKLGSSSLSNWRSGASQNPPASPRTKERW